MLSKLKLNPNRSCVPVTIEDFTQLGWLSMFDMFDVNGPIWVDTWADMIQENRPEWGLNQESYWSG